MTESQDITELKNLGPRSREWLNAIGIFSLSDLERIGAVEIYRQLRELDYPVTLNLVYGIQGAIMSCPWNQLPAEVRDDLRERVEEIKNRYPK